MILAIDVLSSNTPPKGIEIGSEQFPWPVSLAAVLFELSGRNKAVFHTNVRGEGRSVSPGATAKHGITTKESGRCGLQEIIVLGAICGFASEASILTGYNVSFDRAVLESALIRLGKDTRKLMRPGLQIVDLMPVATPFCKLPSERPEGTYKWPRMDEAMATIRHEKPRQGHQDALELCLKAKRLFLSLHARGALDMERAAA